MPQIQNIERFNWQMINQSGIRETTQGNIVVHGQYLTSTTLTPLGIVETLGCYPNSQYQNPGATATSDAGIGSAPPMAMLNGIMNWNLWLGQCHYYASGFGQLKPVINDIDRGFSWTLLPRLSGGQSGGYGFHSGLNPGFGITRNLGTQMNGSTGAYNTATTELITRNTTDQLLSTQIMGDVLGSTGYNNATHLSGYIPGYVYLDRVSGTRYYWRLPTVGVGSGNSQGTYLSLTEFNSTTTNYFVNNLKPLIADTNYASGYIGSTYSSGATKNSYLSGGSISILGTTGYSNLRSSSTTVSYIHFHFIYATTNYIYCVQMTFYQMYGGGSNQTTGSVWRIVKMSYGGTETVVASYNNTTAQATYGYLLPTQPFGVTTTSANVIYPVFTGQATTNSAVPANGLQFALLNINIPGGTETVTLLTNNAANTAQANVFYNKTGINVASSGTPGVINDNDWRFFSTFRTWMVQGTTGTWYINLSFENTYYSYGNYRNRAMTTQPSSTAGSTNPVTPGFVVRDAFCIYSYSIDAGITTATFQGNTNMGTYLPRWYMPVTTTGLVQWVSCAWDSIYDVVIKFNESTYKWDTVANLNYRADQVGVDSLGRIWATSSAFNGTALSPRTGAAVNSGSDAIILEGANLPVQVNVSTPSNAYVYSGSTINTSFTMNVTNFFGSRVASNVLVQLTGGLQFTDGTVQQYIVTSAASDTTTSINVVNGTTSRINTTISQVL